MEFCDEQQNHMLGCSEFGLLLAAAVLHATLRSKFKAAVHSHCKLSANAGRGVIQPMQMARPLALMKNLANAYPGLQPGLGKLRGRWPRIPSMSTATKFGPFGIDDHESVGLGDFIEPGSGAHLSRAPHTTMKDNHGRPFT